MLALIFDKTWLSAGCMILNNICSWCTLLVFPPSTTPLWKFKRLFCLPNIMQNVSMRSHQTLPHLLIVKRIVLAITIRLSSLLSSPAYLEKSNTGRKDGLFHVYGVHPSKLAVLAALFSGVRPHWLVIIRFAPQSSRSCITSRWLWLAARLTIYSWPPPGTA